MKEKPRFDVNLFSDNTSEDIEEDYGFITISLSGDDCFSGTLELCSGNESVQIHYRTKDLDKDQSYAMLGIYADAALSETLLEGQIGKRCGKQWVKLTCGHGKVDILCPQAEDHRVFKICHEIITSCIDKIPIESFVAQEFIEWSFDRDDVGMLQSHNKLSLHGMLTAIEKLKSQLHPKNRRF